jgi:hypothetical protein
MKKITLFLLMLFSFTAFAQFPESFETTVPPAGWASFRGTNGLGTEFDWSVTTTTAFVQTGTQAAFVRWEDVTGGLAEDWLVSPLHTVTAPNTLLTFYQRQQFTVNYGTTYDIRVSTTSQTNHATFTTVLSQTEADLNLTTMTVKSVDLSAYVGQSIYIAFVMTNDDGDNWAIDNVNMESSVAAPGCATLLTPADGATIPVGQVNFSWTAPTTGDAPTSYDFYYGIAPDAVNTFLGNYTTTSINVNVNDYSFTFYWKIVPKNLGGSAIGCPVWTFTTQDPPGYCLSAPNGQYPADTYTPVTCDGLTTNVIVTDGWAGEYSVVNVTSGETYIFSSGSTDFITLSTDAGATAAAFGDTPLTWVANVTGEIRFYSHVDDECGDEDVNRVRSIVCGVVTTDTPDYVNLQFPSAFDITQGGSGTVYGQIYKAGLTDVEPGYSGQAAGIQAWVGISPVGENTNPSTWTNWVDATHNAASVGNNDEYMAEIGTGLTPGTYYYATRFRLNSGDYVYGGINASNDGNFWDGTTYLSGVLTVNEPVFVGCLNDPNGLFPLATFTPACIGITQIITNVGYAGEYSNVNLTSGVEYTFSSSIATDRITIGNVDGTVVLAYGVTPLTWTSNVTDVVRFYLHTDNACGDNTTFRARNIFCGTPPPAPANDNCANAIALTAGAVFADYALTTTSLGATSNVSDPLPSCGAFGFATNGKDVWYSVVVPEAGTITIETQGNAGLADTAIEAYSGTCGALVSISCNDDTTGLFSTLSLTGLTAGETILIRAWGYNGSQGSFVISAFDGSLSATSFDNANFTYYPNPVKDVLNLSYVSNISKAVVVNLLGQQMITANVNATQGQLDLSALASGTYLVKITTEDNLEKTIKVIKQ